ncbi:hypothetical protein DCAR_0519403 [Daucus carota subsp. sativus]|uniref:EF-hand domain-containing protein n=2 Tax=Daucus carota subsp. sativus TaxID=79200 RepID=A0A161ZZ87_DAUCS|nr:hypothetical protein DCAR_0519403 [Daucus carota subsp. sativus]
MKLSNINPKKLFKKKTRSVSRSEQSSFGSSATSSSDDSTHHSKPAGSGTPTSVLPDPTSSDFCDLVQAFKIIDADGDGKITRAELGSLLGRVGSDPLSEEELTMMLRELDSDGDGCISLEEFGAISSAFGPPSGDVELREAFDFFDTDHDGKISAEELLCVFTSIGDGVCSLEDCRRMIKGVDKNMDGFVCFEDFSKMMLHQYR